MLRPTGQFVLDRRGEVGQVEGSDDWERELEKMEWLELASSEVAESYSGLIPERSLCLGPLRCLWTWPQIPDPLAIRIPTNPDLSLTSLVWSGPVALLLVEDPETPRGVGPCPGGWN